MSERDGDEGVMVKRKRFSERMAGLLDRREFLRSLGRHALVGLLLPSGFYLLSRSKPGYGAGSGCRPGNLCSGCPEITQCPDLTALAAKIPDSGLTMGNIVWQLDPEKCVQCGQCATNCVLSPSAVKCVHTYSICGYCKLCFGFFQPGPQILDEAAENQLCPVGAIGRKYVEEPYFEYTIDESLCVGCSKCVKGCNTFGNGSLQLQVRHDRCVNCNECSIARNCPADAYLKVPLDEFNLMRRNLTP